MGFFVEIDEFCSKEDAEKIYKLLLGNSSNTRWQFMENSITPLNKVEVVAKPNRPSVNVWRKELSKGGWGNNFQFVSSTIGENKELCEVLFSSLDKALENIGLIPVEVIRLKANLVSKTNNNRVNEPHIDVEKKHYVLLYYVNDSDGDTLLYEEMFPSRPTEFTLKHSVTPKMGKAIIFDGQTYHSSSNPHETDYRCVVNMDFTASTA